MGKKALQWHPAFQAALQVELAQDRPFLRFYEEYNLSRKPLQMDTLIVKLEPGHAVSKSIGRIFRTYNIVEYKSPEDYISVNDFYKVLGYVCVYQADTRKVLEIVPEELTITLVGDHYPGRLVRHLKKRYGVRVRNVHKGSCQKRNTPGLAGSGKGWTLSWISSRLPGNIRTIRMTRFIRR